MARKITFAEDNDDVVDTLDLMEMAARGPARYVPRGERTDEEPIEQ